MSETVAGERGQQLAALLEAASDELAGLISGMSAEEWQAAGRPAPDTPDWSVGEVEKRPAGCIAYHIASVIGAPHTFLVKAAAEGETLDLVRSWTVDNVAEWNAGVAEAHADVQPPEVLDLLDANTKAAAEIVRGLTPEQLEREIAPEDQQALVAWCGGARTVDELIQRMLIGHIGLHRSSLRAMLGR
jgi:hypothetical protein